MTIIVLVLLAIFAFWMSTQQSGLPLRLPIWIAGAGLIVIAGYLALQAGGHDAVIAGLSDAWSNKDDPTEGVLFQALSSNAPTVQRYVTPLLDLLILFGVILGAFALLALTPGDFLERAFVRPLAIAILGGAVGASLALAIVAIAIGGPVSLNRYVGYGDPENSMQVYDGDTFSVGDASVRLLDVDAPERTQICRAGGATTYKCGAEAQRALADLIADAIVDCQPSENAQGRTRASYNRPLVTCEVRRTVEGRTTTRPLGAEMLRLGMAVPYAYDDAAGAAEPEDVGVARRQKRGLWKYCTLHPKVWRDEPGARERFKKSGEIPADPAKSIGDCAAQTKTAA